MDYLELFRTSTRKHRCVGEEQNAIAQKRRFLSCKMKGLGQDEIERGISAKEPGTKQIHKNLPCISLEPALNSS